MCHERRQVLLNLEYYTTRAPIRSRPSTLWPWNVGRLPSYYRSIGHSSSSTAKAKGHPGASRAHIPVAAALFFMARRLADSRLSSFSVVKICERISRQKKELSYFTCATYPEHHHRLHKGPREYNAILGLVTPSLPIEHAYGVCSTSGPEHVYPGRNTEQCRQSDRRLRSPVYVVELVWKRARGEICQSDKGKENASQRSGCRRFRKRVACIVKLHR